MPPRPPVSPQRHTQVLAADGEIDVLAEPLERRDLSPDQLGWRACPSLHGSELQDIDGRHGAADHPLTEILDERLHLGGLGHGDILPSGSDTMGGRSPAHQLP